MRRVAQKETSCLVELPFRLTNGASVKLTGTLVESPGQGQAQELLVTEAQVLGECDPEVRCELL